MFKELLILTALVGLAGCGLAPPKQIGGDADHVAIKLAGMGVGNPEDLANQHCAKFSKKAVLDRVEPLRQVYFFDCR